MKYERSYWANYSFNKYFIKCPDVNVDKLTKFLKLRKFGGHPN
jgi:hypothetical protein